MANNSSLFLIHAVALLSASVLFVVVALSALRTESRLKTIYIFLLIATAAYGTWLRFDHSPRRFKVFYQEYETYNTTRMIAGENDFSTCISGTYDKCEKKTPSIYATGFPFAGAIAMKLTGRNSPDILFILNMIMGVVCIPAVFIMSMAGTGNPRASIFAAIAASALPLNVILSGNATTETADLLFLCVTFTFLFMYMKNKNILPGLGLLAAAALSILIEPRNVYTAAFILATLLAARTRGAKGIVAALAGAALLALLVSVLPPVYRTAFTISATDYSGVLKTNLKYFAAGAFTPLFVSIPLVLAPVFLGKRCGATRSMFFFPLIILFAVSMNNILLPQGDFPRMMLPATVSLALFFGVAADWIIESIKNSSVRNGVIAVCLTLFLISSFNESFVVLRDFAEAQDDLISVNLPKNVGNCSVFSTNSSIGMIYTKNPSYEMDNLLDGKFLQKHPECKIVVFEMSCAASQSDECVRVFNKFKPKKLYIGSVFDYYNLMIGLVPADSSANINK